MPKMTATKKTQQELPLPSNGAPQSSKPFKSQLLKWVGNKQKQADDIISYFPKTYGTYFEPFLGSGGVLGVLAPKKAVAGDVYKPLVEIWQTLHTDKELLKHQYAERYALSEKLGKKEAYKKILDRYNLNPNGADLLFLCRACYGGVVRFRKSDGFMSTPVGIHNPISPESFSERAELWFSRTINTTFLHQDFSKTFAMAKKGDLIYCDPPYVDSQSILYGAQSFSLLKLFESIDKAKSKGVFVVLSIEIVRYRYSKKSIC
jgi:DNA adenine methylase